MLLKFFEHKNFKSFLLLALLVFMIWLNAAHAGTDTGDGFDEIWKKSAEYIQGAGRVLVGLIMILGIAAAIVRQSLLTFAIATGAAIGLFYSPTIIESVMSSTNAVVLSTVGGI